MIGPKETYKLAKKHLAYMLFEGSKIFGTEVSPSIEITTISEPPSYKNVIGFNRLEITSIPFLNPFVYETILKNIVFYPLVWVKRRTEYERLYGDLEDFIVAEIGHESQHALHDFATKSVVFKEVEEKFQTIDTDIKLTKNISGKIELTLKDEQINSSICESIANFPTYKILRKLGKSRIAEVKEKYSQVWKKRINGLDYLHEKLFLYPNEIGSGERLPYSLLVRLLYRSLIEDLMRMKFDKNGIEYFRWYVKNWTPSKTVKFQEKNEIRFDGENTEENTKKWLDNFDEWLKKESHQ